MTTQTATTITTAALVAERSRATSLCLVVHDELELRLRLAGLVRKAVPKLDADTVTKAGFEAISIDRIRAYSAVMFIIEFSPPEAATASLAALARLHEQLPNLPIFVFARGGNERSAAKAMKLGARDYWPIHSVIVTELCNELQPIVDPRADCCRGRPRRGRRSLAATGDRRLHAAQENRTLEHRRRLSRPQRRIQPAGGAQNSVHQGLAARDGARSTCASNANARFSPSSITARLPIFSTTASPRSACIWRSNTSPAAVCATA